MKPTTKDYLYVTVQFLLFLAYLLEVSLPDLHHLVILRTVGSALSIAGVLVLLLALLQLNRNLSPFPTPKSNAELIRTGLYKYIRHPIYTGILLTVFGYALHEASLYKLLIASCLLLLFYLKSSYEEKRLLEVYPEYEEYRATTGRFFIKLF
jgi:protein-S-isoprenylcysteine O-methyltransferase Ste14